MCAVSSTSYPPWRSRPSTRAPLAADLRRRAARTRDACRDQQDAAAPVGAAAAPWHGRRSTHPDRPRAGTRGTRPGTRPITPSSSHRFTAPHRVEAVLVTRHDDATHTLGGDRERGGLRPVTATGFSHRRDSPATTPTATGPRERRSACRCLRNRSARAERGELIGAR